MVPTGVEVLKLNLGARNRAVPGFLSMDCDTHEGVDIVGDVSDLSRFKDGEVSEILASHILEHFPHPKTASVLKEWARVLKPGGILYLGVPDFARAVEIYNKHGMSAWLRNWICGDQIYATAYHYNIFDERTLKEMLLAAGFSEASRVADLPVHGDKDCSTLVDTFERRPLSLNVLAVR